MKREKMSEWMARDPKLYPTSSKMLSSAKQIALFLVGWIGFRIFSTIVQVILLSFINRADLTAGSLAYYGAVMTINTTSYLALIVALILICNIDLLKLTKSFTQISSIVAGLICLAVIFGFNALYGNFVRLIQVPIKDNINEASIVSLESLFPVGSMIVFGFIGPICEELTYRVGLFSFFRRKSRALAYGVTIVVFALIHFNFTTTSLLNEILNLPYYAFAALAFSFVYERYGFAASLTAHIINNVISIALVSVIH